MKPIPKKGWFSTMSDSTKKLLASSLRELMHKRPLSRITVGDICELCDMNRKSFYYHFHDKFELVTWIFTHELNEALAENPRDDQLSVLCSCLHNHAIFYRTALQQLEQNPLCMCMDDALRPMLAARMTPGIEEIDPLALDLCVHAVRSILIRWVQGGCMQSAADFTRTLYHACAQLSRIPA